LQALPILGKLGALQCVPSFQFNRSKSAKPKGGCIVQVEPRDQSTQDLSNPVSEPVIPSERGVFYRYSAEFTGERPLCYLMKCKANKSRPINDAEQNANEIDLTFVFGNGVRVCSPKALLSLQLLDDRVVAGALNQTWISSAGISEQTFQQLRELKDGSALARVARVAISRNDQIVTLTPGTILAVTTESGKYGLFLVKEITESSVKVDACHILL